MKIEIDTAHAHATGDFLNHGVSIALALEGRKRWITDSKLRFEPTGHNVNVLKEHFEDCVVIDNRPPVSYLAPDTVQVDERGFKIPPFDFQLRNFDLFKDKPVFAIFSEQGTGKSSTFIDIMSYRWLTGALSGVLMFSSPKGVHAQWVDTMIPKHIWDSVEYQAAFWEGKKAPHWFGKRGKPLQFYSANIDALKSDKFLTLIEPFVASHKGTFLVCVDESQSIKNASSKRAKAAKALGARANQRAIMTGTPLSKDLTDEWSQFQFLDEEIIGHKYKTSFMAQYCRMGGPENRQVIGHRNLEQFKRITAPYIFRATKKELNFDQPFRSEVHFDMSTEQNNAITSIRENFIAVIEAQQQIINENPNNERERNKAHNVIATTGAVALLRAQQISCGFAVDEDKNVIPLKENPRLDTARQLIKDLPEEAFIIWCRFKFDVNAITELLGRDQVAQYFGETSATDRAANKEAFIARKKRFFVATTQTAGTGVDGLQKVCSRAIYYSNSFNAIDRWQSEDRINRIGMLETPTYIDLVGRRSPDRRLLTNLAQKRSLSSAVLDDVKEALGG